MTTTTNECTLTAHGIREMAIGLREAPVNQHEAAIDLLRSAINAGHGHLLTDAYYSLEGENRETASFLLKLAQSAATIIPIGDPGHEGQRFELMALPLLFERQLDAPPPDTVDRSEAGQAAVRSALRRRAVLEGDGQLVPFDRLWSHHELSVLDWAGLQALTLAACAKVTTRNADWPDPTTDEHLPSAWGLRFLLVGKLSHCSAATEPGRAEIDYRIHLQDESDWYALADSAFQQALGAPVKVSEVMNIERALCVGHFIWANKEASIRLDHCMHVAGVSDTSQILAHPHWETGEPDEPRLVVALTWRESGASMGEFEYPSNHEAGQTMFALTQFLDWQGILLLNAVH